MSDFTFSVGSTACEILSWTGVSAGSCYQPTDMSVLGTILLGLTLLMAGVRSLRRD